MAYFFLMMPGWAGLASRLRPLGHIITNHQPLVGLSGANAWLKPSLGEVEGWSFLWVGGLDGTILGHGTVLLMAPCIACRTVCGTLITLWFGATGFQHSKRLLTFVPLPNIQEGRRHTGRALELCVQVVMHFSLYRVCHQFLSPPIFAIYPHFNGVLSLWKLSMRG